MDFLNAELEYQAITDAGARWAKACEMMSTYVLSASDDNLNIHNRPWTFDFVFSGRYGGQRPDSCGKRIAAAALPLARRNGALEAMKKFASQVGIQSAAAPSRPGLVQCKPNQPGPHANQLTRDYFAPLRQVVRRILKTKFPFFENWGYQPKWKADPQGLCPTLGEIERTETSFPLLRSAFCEDEKKAYANRPKAEKKEARSAVKTFFHAQCQADETFSPEEWDAKAGKWQVSIQIKSGPKEKKPQGVPKIPVPPQVPPPPVREPGAPGNLPVPPKHGKKGLRKGDSSVLKAIDNTHGKDQNRQRRDSSVVQAIDETHGKEEPNLAPEGMRMPLSHHNNVPRPRVPPPVKHDFSKKQTRKDSSVLQAIDETHGRNQGIQIPVPPEKGKKQTKKETKGNVRPDEFIV